MRSLLAAQQTFVDRLVQLMKAVQRESGNRKKKVSEHRNMQKNDSAYIGLDAYLNTAVCVFVYHFKNVQIF